MRKPSTRDRVLDAALSLLNRHGPGAVTTRGIAEACGINEGNLYYHFRTREALLTALFDRFEAQALAAIEPVAAEGPTRYAAALQRWFGVTWEYRFLFRDALAIGTEAPAVRRALRRLSLRLTTAAGETLAAMEAQGMLRIPDAQRDALRGNLAIVSSYWVSFLAMQRGTRSMTGAHLRWGEDQVRALLMPYLVKEAAPAAAGGDRPPS